jgi:NAD(P)H-dependent FMN reductase
MKIVGFAGSNSQSSINRKLVKYALSLFPNDSTALLDLNEYEVHLYRPDREKAEGIPSRIQEFAEIISSSDLIVLSLAEHNGTYSAAFKNVYDWVSRIPNRKVFDGKPVLLMATSPGGRGGASVLNSAQDRFPRDGAELKAVFSLPSFNDNFDTGKVRITNVEKNEELKQIVKTVLEDF